MAWLKWSSFAGLLGAAALTACCGCQAVKGNAESSRPPVQPADLYVAPSGNDTWSGKLPEPNRDGNDGPFATLARARDEVRKLKMAGRPASS